MQKNVFKKQQIILFTFVPKLILIRCTSLLAPKIMPLLQGVEQWFHCAIYFGTICYRYQRLPDIIYTGCTDIKAAFVYVLEIQDYAQLI